MKKCISLILSAVLILAVALCTPVIATVISIDDVGDYTCDAGSVFIFKAPEAGTYAITACDNKAQLLTLEYDDGAEEAVECNKDDGGLCIYIFLEAGEGVRCKIDTNGNGERVSFVIQSVTDAVADVTYEAQSNTCYSFTADHDDYYNVTSFNGGDPYVEVLLPDGNRKIYDDESGLDFSGDLYLEKGDTIFLNVKDYENTSLSFKVSCDCSGYGDIRLEAGKDYTVSDGIQLLFTAPEEGLYTFESKGENDPCFEYVQRGKFSFFLDDVSAGNLNFKGQIYLEKGERLRCIISEKDGQTVNLSVTYGGICKHKGTQWTVYRAATTEAKGIKTKVCKECKFICDYKEIARPIPETPVASAVNTIDGVYISWNKIGGAVKYAVYRRASGETQWVRIKTTTANTYLDKAAKNNVQYYYSARAFNSSGEYSVYDSGRIAKVKRVSAPVLTKISNTTTGIRVDWSKVSGATGYRVYRRADGVDYWTYLGLTKDIKYVDSSVKAQNGKGYTYTVRAVNGVDSGFDGVGLYTIRLSDPVMSSAVSSKNGITVKWGSVKGSTAYYVYRKTAGSGWVRLATVKGADNVTYLDETAKKGVTYTYTAKAVNGKYLSAYSSTINCKDKY